MLTNPDKVVVGLGIELGIKHLLLPSSEGSRPPPPTLVVVGTLDRLSLHLKVNVSFEAKLRVNENSKHVSFISRPLDLSCNRVDNHLSLNNLGIVVDQLSFSRIEFQLNRGIIVSQVLHCIVGFYNQVWSGLGKDHSISVICIDVEQWAQD